MDLLYTTLQEYGNGLRSRQRIKENSSVKIQRIILKLVNMKIKKSVIFYKGLKFNYQVTFKTITENIKSKY